MKELGMKCKTCGTILILKSRTVNGVLKKLSDSGWKDEMNEKGKLEFTCPKCAK